eukprot:6479417-Amphidinium_carterae.1
MKSNGLGGESPRWTCIGTALPKLATQAACANRKEVKQQTRSNIYTCHVNFLCLCNKILEENSQTPEPNNYHVTGMSNIETITPRYVHLLHFQAVETPTWGGNVCSTCVVESDLTKQLLSDFFKKLPKC